MEKTYSKNLIKNGRVRRGYCQNFEVDSLCDFLRGEMKRKKITQQAAADFLGMTQGMFSRKIKDGSFDIRELKELRVLLEVPSETIARFI